MRFITLLACAVALAATSVAQPSASLLLSPGPAAPYGPAQPDNPRSGHSAEAYGSHPAPLTFVKILGAPQRRELAFSMCLSADGNVYVAGKQGDHPMLAKISPLGEPLWVRNFPPVQPNEPVEWSEVIEDSDGMVLLCGTEGSSPSNRRAIVMRYDPVAGAVLWYKRIAGNHPVGVSLVEKGPGGNFVLQTNYQGLLNGVPGVRTEFFEIRRNDGNTTGSSVGYLGQKDLTLAATVLHNGNLYTAGSWSTNVSAEVRPFIAKLSPGTFIAQWAYILTPDTASGAANWMAPADLAFDGDNALIAGSGHLNPLTSADGVFVFLEKHHPDGSLAWMKRYDMAMTPEEVLTLDSAYVVFGRMTGSNQFGMLKTDVDGNVLAARVLTAAPAAPGTVGFAARQNLALRLPGHLLMLDHTWETDESDLVLIRTNPDLGLDGVCDALQTLTVNSQTLTATSAVPPVSISTNTPAGIATTATASFQADSLPVFLLCPADDSNPDPDPCQPNTFLKVYGDTIKQDNIAALRAAPDGNIYVAGGKADGYAIGKMTPAGDILWLRNFTGTVQDRVFVTEIIVDSEGMIAGSGRRNGNAGTETVVFRYDPAANQTLWELRLDVNNPFEGGILEKTPGGNYLLYHSPNKPAQFLKSAEILELDRLTGQIVPAFAKRYANQAQQVFAGLVLHNGSLFATGYTDSLLPGNITVRRMILVRLDANTGDVQWSRTGLTPWSQTSYFRGIDLIVDDSSLIVLSHGIESSNSPIGPGKVVPVYLHRTSLDGEVLWAQKYLLTEVPREVVATPDGYVIFCGNTKRHLLKTDKAGNLLFTKVLNTPGYISAGFEDWQKNQIERVGSHLYTTDFTARANAAGQYTSVLKTDLNLDMAFNCGLELLPVQDTAMVNPALFAAQQAVSASPTTAQATALTNSPGSILVHQACPFCPTPPCTDKPDLAVQLESIGCDSAAFAHYRVCNTGAQPFSGTLNVGVYDANPLTGAAVLLDFLALTIDKLPPDSCQTGTLSNLVYWGNRTKVYTLAGIKSGQNTPIDPAGFPYNGIAECDYANNLDSLGFQYPPAPPKPDLGPDLVLCAGDTITLDAGAGFAAYSWSNGPTTQAVPVSATGAYIVKATDACGRILRDTAAVTVLPLPAPTLLTIEFYPGDTITLNGIAYTQSDTATIVLGTADGCDSVVTYILKRVVTQIDLMCPPDLPATIPANQAAVAVSYPAPSAATDCPDPAIVLTRLQGPPSGGLFSPGSTPVCYEAVNQCGIRDTCCFTVTAQQAPAETACDIKIPPGSCIRYELLNIRLDAQGNPRYRMRLTNTCASPLTFAYFQLPDGITAEAPAEGATYTAPGGNTYLVRNPNAAPYHSIRFKPQSGALNNGKSDIFEFTLPKQALPLFILVTVKLKDGTTSEAHLNTFNCPVQPYVAPPVAPAGVQNRNTPAFKPAIHVLPNPTGGLLSVRLYETYDAPLQLSVLNGQGQLVLNSFYPSENGQINLILPDGLANGIYFLRVQAPGGDPVATRFVLVR